MFPSPTFLKSRHNMTPVCAQKKLSAQNARNLESGTYGNLEIWKSRNLESRESENLKSIMLEIWESKTSKQYGFKILDMGNGPRCLGGNYGTAKKWDMKKCGANKNGTWKNLGPTKNGTWKNNEQMGN